MRCSCPILLSVVPRRVSPPSCFLCSDVHSPPPQLPLLIPLNTLPPSTAGPSLPPYVLPKMRRTTIRCPNKLVGNDCCAYVSTHRRLCGVAGQYCYRSYEGESPRRPGPSVSVPYVTPVVFVFANFLVTLIMYNKQQTEQRTRYESPTTRQRLLIDSQK